MQLKMLNIKATFKELDRKKKEVVRNYHRGQVAKLVAELKKETPVDTGEARDGWVSQETPNGAIVENNVEHIAHLNAGSSQQAPSHFVEKVALKYGKPYGNLVEIS